MVTEVPIFAPYINLRSPDILITILLAPLPSLRHLKLPIKLLIHRMSRKLTGGVMPDELLHM